MSYTTDTGRLQKVINESTTVVGLDELDDNIKSIYSTVQGAIIQSLYCTTLSS